MYEAGSNLSQISFLRTTASTIPFGFEFKIEAVKKKLRPLGTKFCSQFGSTHLKHRALAWSWLTNPFLEIWGAVGRHGDQLLRTSAAACSSVGLDSSR